MTDIDTAHLRTLAEKATPSPWTVKALTDSTEYGDYEVYGIDGNVAEPIQYFDSEPAHVALAPMELEDAAYIAAADPQTVLALIDEIERLRGEGEWEYGVHLGATGDIRAHTSRRLAVSDARGKSTITHPDGRVEVFDRALMRRRKAGPWETVEKTGGENDG